MSTERTMAAQCVFQLKNAFEKLSKKGLSDSLYLSGLVFSITDLGGVNFCDDFMVRGEDLEPVRVALVSSLVEQLKEKRNHLNMQLSEIDKAIGPEENK